MKGKLNVKPKAAGCAGEGVPKLRGAPKLRKEQPDSRRLIAEEDRDEQDTETEVEVEEGEVEDADADMQEEEMMIDAAMQEALPLLQSLTDMGITQEIAMNMLREYAGQLDLADRAMQEDLQEE